MLIFLMPLQALDYIEYVSLDDGQREKLVRRYVKEKDGLNSIRLKAYALYGDVSKAELFHMAVMMEDFYKQFKKQFKGSFKNRQTPQLYLMKNYSSMARAYANWVAPARGSVPNWAAGLFARYGDKRALFGNAEHGAQTLTTMKHEGTHQLLDAYLGTRVPTWFNEGTADVFETFEMDRSMENNLAQNLFASSHPQNAYKRFSGRRIPFEKLVLLDGKQWSAASGDGVTIQYMSSWIAVHYMLTNKRGLPIYQKLLKAIKSGKFNPKKIFSSSSLTTLEKAIKKHEEEVILPHAEHVGRIETYREKGMIEQMQKLSKAYQKAHPASPEASFYVILSTLLGESSAEEEDASYSKDLLGLEKKHYQHPDMDYALALAYEREGNTRRAGSYLRQMLANAPRHKISLELQEKWEKKPGE